MAFQLELNLGIKICNNPRFKIENVKMRVLFHFYFSGLVVGRNLTYWFRPFYKVKDLADQLDGLTKISSFNSQMKM